MSSGSVLLFTEFESGLGGVEQYVASLTGQLTETGWKVTVVCGTPGESSVFGAAVRVETIPGLTSALRRRRELDRRLDEVLDASQPDLIHLHLVNTPAYTRFLAERYPTVASVHNHFLTCPSGFRLLHGPEQQCGLQPGAMCVVNAYMRRCNSRRPGAVVSGLTRTLANRRAIETVARFMVHGPYMRGTLIDGGIPREKIRIVPSLPRPVFKPGGPMAPEPTLLFAGRLTEEKGVQVLLDVLPSLTGVRLIVAGEGHFRGPLERRVANLGLGDRVLFVGRKGGEELAELYRQSWALVMPSLWPEPFGLGGLEAMASGRAVIAFDSGDIGSWLTDGLTGRLVPWNDRLKLAEAVHEICRPGVAAAFGQAGRNEFEERFSDARHIELIDAVYRELI
jgi:glycosyltransferase involved in cell wall biosynthesis